MNVLKKTLADQRSDNMKKKFDTEVFDQIVRFLRGHQRESKNTFVAYDRDIRQFFLKTRGKNIEHLTQKDLVFTSNEFDDYQSYLIDEMKLSKSTSNRNITSISECIKALHKQELIENIRFLDIKRPTITANSHDGLTHDEIIQASEFVLTQGRESTARVKNLLILFCFDTCMRLEECLNLTWSNFIVKDDGLVSVRTQAKGNKTMIRDIDFVFYEKLLLLKRNDSEKVFNIGVATVNRMMPDIREYLGIDPNNRNIVFHSIRKAGAQFLWEEFRDINQVSRALGHSSIQTTELYINKDETYGILGAISSSYRVDSDSYKTVSHEDLLKAIGSLGKDKQMFINLELQKIENSDQA